MDTLYIQNVVILISKAVSPQKFILLCELFTRIIDIVEYQEAEFLNHGEL